MVDAATAARLRTGLEQDRVRLEAEMAELAKNERDSLSDASGENVYRDHMGDQGSATFEREMDLTLEENERDLLDDVRLALARMDADTYGICTRCGAEIPVARLEAVPTADLCITCKAAEESR